MEISTSRLQVPSLEVKASGSEVQELGFDVHVPRLEEQRSPFEAQVSS
ncbi:MAG: hypothetical protein HC769_26355 [Cyanobacteria bacterium CRU_2_1]|nr:hypothetical protein [Cyanobacteria bacterium RU_5_0]NJR62041.1 hypothetical protein [Cyanobacteria bacterium CRU_2_1]